MGCIYSESNDTKISSVPFCTKNNQPCFFITADDVRCAKEFGRGPKSKTVDNEEENENY
jgi:hypothetical protein